MDRTFACREIKIGDFILEEEKHSRVSTVEPVKLKINGS